ncbi:MAG: hypothetical protein QOG10_4572 [Kribbellaceae bacterium]|jgi:hypothetical protein|nr:hypothetical protein [Kribbellaceae bacterium]
MHDPLQPPEVLLEHVKERLGHPYLTQCRVVSGWQGCQVTAQIRGLSRGWRLTAFAARSADPIADHYQAFAAYLLYTRSPPATCG